MQDNLDRQLKDMFRHEVSIRSNKPFDKPILPDKKGQPLWIFLGRAGLVAALSFLLWGGYWTRQPSELDRYFQTELNRSEWKRLLHQSAEIVQCMLVE